MWRFLKKLEIELPYDPEILLLGIHTEETRRERDTCTPMFIAALQASLSNTNSQSSPRLTSIESVMPSSHLILCRPLLLLPPIPPCIRVFSNKLTLRTRWPKYWSFSFSIIPSNINQLKIDLITLIRSKIFPFRYIADPDIGVRCTRAL